MARRDTLGMWIGIGWLLAASTLAAQEPVYPPLGYGRESMYPGADYGEGFIAAPMPYEDSTAAGLFPPTRFDWQADPAQPTWFSQDGKHRPERHWDGFFLRTEYLLWDFKRPGDVLLGAPILGVDNPRLPFPVFDNQIPPNQIANAIVPSLKEMSLKDTSGVRGTAGIPLTFGSFEANIWGFEKAEEDIKYAPIFDLLNAPDDNFLVGTSTTINGVIGNNIFLYNDSYRARFTSSVWGTEGNVFFDGPQSNLFSIKPLLGVRYLNLQEELQQRGSFVDPIGLAPTVNTEIDSTSNNHLFVGQFGARTEFTTRWLTLQFDPKVGFGSNSYRNTVRTFDVRAAGEGETRYRDDDAQLIPMVDLAFNGRIHVTPRLSLTAGYNFMWIGRVTRPHNNIIYDDDPAAAQSTIRLGTTKTDFKMQGLTVGAELRF